MFDNMALGKRMKYYRNKKNLSQKQLADLVDMPQSTISRLERGVIGLFNIKKLSILADALDVTLDDLLYDSIDSLKKQNENISFSHYEMKLKELLLTFNDNQLLFYNHLIENFVTFKELSQKEKKE